MVWSSLVTFLDFGYFEITLNQESCNKILKNIFVMMFRISADLRRFRIDNDSNWYYDYTISYCEVETLRHRELFLHKQIELSISTL